jgi:hypothetical protein
MVCFRKGESRDRLRHRALLATLALSFAIVQPVAGQFVWDTPRMIGPESRGGFGLYWMRAGALPGDGDAVMGTWTLPGFDGAVAVRGGGGRGAGDEIAGFGGVDVRAPLARHTERQPIDLEWSGGLGAGVGEYVLVSVPVGLSAGRSWSSGSVWFAPYVYLGIALDFRTGDEAPDEEFDVQGSAEVGFDLALDRARRFVIRASGALADRQAFAVGFAISGGS